MYGPHAKLDSIEKIPMHPKGGKDQKFHNLTFASKQANKRAPDEDGKKKFPEGSKPTSAKLNNCESEAIGAWRGLESLFAGYI